MVQKIADAGKFEKNIDEQDTSDTTVTSIKFNVEELLNRNIELLLR